MREIRAEFIVDWCQEPNASPSAMDRPRTGAASLRIFSPRCWCWLYSERCLGHPRLDSFMTRYAKLLQCRAGRELMITFPRCCFCICLALFCKCFYRKSVASCSSPGVPLLPLLIKTYLFFSGFFFYWWATRKYQPRRCCVDRWCLYMHGVTSSTPYTVG